MRTLLLASVLSAFFLACGGEPSPGPNVPSTDLSEAGAPSTPPTPSTPAK